MSEHCARHRGDSFGLKCWFIRARDTSMNAIEFFALFNVTSLGVPTSCWYIIYTFKRRRSFCSQIFGLNRIIMCLLPTILSPNRARIGKKLIRLEMWRRYAYRSILFGPRPSIFIQSIYYLYIYYVNFRVSCGVYIICVCVWVFFIPLHCFWVVVSTVT